MSEHGPQSPVSADRGSTPPGRTGEPGVDAALDGLDRLADRPVAEHPEVYDEVHRLLQGALVELDGD